MCHWLAVTALATEGALSDLAYEQENPGLPPDMEGRSFGMAGVRSQGSGVRGQAWCDAAGKLHRRADAQVPLSGSPSSKPQHLKKLSQAGDAVRLEKQEPNMGALS